MNVTKENIDDLNALLHVTIEGADYEENYKNALKTQAKKMNLKGFRPGKVPVNVVRSMAGESILLDEINKSLQAALGEYFEKEDLPLVGQPMPMRNEELELDTVNGKNYNFSFEIGLEPSFELNLEVKPAVPSYEVSINDEYLNKELRIIQLSYGESTNPEVAEADDTIYGKLKLRAGEESKFPEGWESPVELNKITSLNPEFLNSKKLIKKIVGLKKEDVLESIKLDEIYENDRGIRNFWDFNVRGERIAALTDEDLEVIKAMEFDFEVMKINRIAPSEFDKTLYQKMFKEETELEGAEIEAKIREKTIENLTEQFTDAAKQRFRNDLQKAIVENNEMPLPEAFLKKWLIQSNEEVNEKNVDEVYKDYAKSLRWTMVFNQVIKANPEVKTTTEEVEAHATERTREYMGDNLEGDEDGTRLKAMVGHLLQDQNTYNQLFKQVADDKLFDHLNTVVKTTKKKITASKFIDLPRG